MRIIFFTFLLLFAFSIGYSEIPPQLESAKNKPPSDRLAGKLYVTAGLQWFDMSDLNSRLSANLYPVLPYHLYSLGICYQLSEGNILSDIELDFFIERKVDSADFTSAVGAWYAWYNIGYLLLNTSAIQIYPLVGLGGGVITVKLTEKTVSKHFDQILSQPLTIIEFNKSGFILNAALAIDLILDLGKVIPIDLVLGIRGGYVQDTSSGEGWTANSLQTTEGPATGLSGFYVRLMLGIEE